MGYLRGCLRFVLFWALCAPVHAATYVVGEGRFYRRDGDSSAFVQKQLLYSAFRDAITKELNEMGLDSKRFWNNYEAKFEESFKSVGESVRKGFVDKRGSLPRSARAKYEKALRLKRLSSKSTFGNLNKAVSSYAIKNRAAPSAKSPRSHRVTVNARVDRRVLHRTYLLFTSDRQMGAFQKLFVSVDVRTKNIEGFDPRTGRSDNFAQVVLDNWGEWFQKNMQGLFREVVRVENPGSMGLESASRERDKTAFGGALWLKVNVQIEQISEDRLFRYGDFVTKVDFLLLDLTTDSAVAYADLEETKARLQSDSKDLASELAGIVYRKPLEEFSKMRDSAGRFSTDRKSLELTIGNVSNLLDILELSEYISDRGIVHRIMPHISSYDGTEALITLGFSGKRESVLAFLKGLDKKTFSNGKMLVVGKENYLSILKVPKKDG